MPSTIRKLAEALGVEPAALLGERPELSDRQPSFESDRLPTTQGREHWPIPHILGSAQEDVLREDIQQVLKQGMEEWNQQFSAVYEYEAEIAVARSKMSSGDPQDVLEITQLAKRKVYDVYAAISGVHDILNADFADWYYMGGHGSAEFKAELEMLLTKAGEAAQAWLDFYNQCLDWLDDEIIMRRGEVTTIEAFVRRLHQRRAPDSGERALGQEKPPIRRPN